MAVKDNMNLPRNLNLLQNVSEKKSLFCQLFHIFDAFPVDNLSEIMNKWKLLVANQPTYISL